MSDERCEFLGRQGAHVSFVRWRVREFAGVAHHTAEAPGVLEERAEQLAGCQYRARTNGRGADAFTESQAQQQASYCRWTRNSW